MTSKLIYGKNISEKVTLYIKKEFGSIKSLIQPHLAIIQVGDLMPSNVYVRKKIEMAKNLKFVCSLMKWDRNTSESQIINCIQQLNHDPKICGIMLQLPLDSECHPDPLNCLNAIKTEKDIEGLNYENSALLGYGRVDQAYIPCTSAAALSIVELAGWKVDGLNIVVVGNGITAGSKSSLDLSNHISKSDLIISAIGKTNIIDGKWIKEGSAIIDYGVHRLENHAIVGDINITSCIDKLSWRTPIPGGIGPATTSWLFLNLFESFRRFIGLPMITFPQHFNLIMSHNQVYPEDWFNGKIDSN
ncbi:hypothetical protein MXB_5407 [Myxobolus squamalis]|nr:hypothetical protein MXB_5407 [Myxobolus squamalis]